MHVGLGRAGTQSPMDSFEMDENVQRISEPVMTSSRELPPITEQAVQRPTLQIPKEIVSQPIDPSPSTSISDHTAMNPEMNSTDSKGDLHDTLTAPPHRTS